MKMKYYRSCDILDQISVRLILDHTEPLPQQPQPQKLILKLDDTYQMLYTVDSSDGHWTQFEFFHMSQQ